MIGNLHEECGVFGIYDRDQAVNVAASCYYALCALQHRGQESCGIAVNDDGVILVHRDCGLVRDVFTREVMDKLPQGRMAIGHTRYSTTGGQNISNAQPLVVRHIKGHMALAHNGNLTNAQELRGRFSTAPATRRSSPIRSPGKGFPPRLLRRRWKRR